MKQSDAYEMIGDLIDRLTEEKHHAVYEHEYKTDEQLKTRIAVEKKNAASCFNEGIDITEVIIDAIEESSEILPWLTKSSEDILIIKAECENCGKKFLRSIEHNWENGAITCNQFEVILSKYRDKYSFVDYIYLYTAYPV